MNIATRNAEPAPQGLVSSPVPAPPPPRRARPLPVPMVALLMLLAALAFRSLGLVQAVIDTDEGLYMVQAREWLRGAWPLVAVWDMHPIGAPGLFALAFALFGEGIAAVRLLGILAVGLAGTAVFAAVRAAGAPRALGIGAGLIYVAHTVRMGGLATNTEILFAPLVVAAMALGIRGAVRARRRDAAPQILEVAAMGLAIGLALAIKPVAAPEGCLAFALLVGPALGRGLLGRGLPGRGLSGHGVAGWRRALALAAGYAALCALPTLLIAAAYWWLGELETFVNCAFLAPLRYSHGGLGAAEAAHRLVVAVLTLLWPFLLALVALARWLPRPGPGGMLARVGLAWFAAGSLAIVGPGFYFPHYFLIWLPPLAVLTALGCWRLSRLVPPRSRSLAFGLLVAAVAVGSWRADATARVDRGIGTFAPDPVRQVAAAVAGLIAPGEPILVANYHPVVYVLAGAGLPTRYVFPAHLTGAFGEVSGVRMDAEVARVLASRPRVIVVDRGWWSSMRPDVAGMITATLASAYELAGTVAEERGPIEIWRRP